MLLLYSGSQFIILPQSGRGDIGGVGGIGHIGVGSVGDEGDRGNVVDGGRGRGGVGSIIYSLRISQVTYPYLRNPLKLSMYRTLLYWSQIPI